MFKGKKVVKKEATASFLVSGLFDCTPVAVNPTQEELKKLGINSSVTNYV